MVRTAPIRPPGSASMNIEVRYPASEASIPAGDDTTLWPSEEPAPTTTVTNTVKASADLPSYLDFYLLVDVSGSMGLPATPAEMDKLVALTGVGRKTANVVLGHALGIPGLPVDRHVLRVANRLGIAVGDDPVAVEQQLCKKLPPERWTRASDTLILHGRRVCRPTPACDRCAANDLCRYFRSLGATRTTAPRPKPGVRKPVKAVTRARR